MAKNKKIKPVKAIIVLCEGKTDVAFLRRLLKTDGYNDYKQDAVYKIPKPFGLAGDKNDKGSYFINKLKTYKYDSGRLHDRPILPIILRRTQGQSDIFLLLYDMNSMDRPQNYREIITDFNKLTLPIEDDYFEAFTPIDAAIAFIYDLDDKSVTERLQHIQSNYADLIPELEHLSKNKQITSSKNYKSIGYHFLKKDDSDAGNLEDIVLPLMKKGNEHLFDKAADFLNSNGFIRLKKDKSKDENKTQSDLKKSLIGTVGQLEHSGLGNADIFKLTALLNKDKLKNSSQCQAIIKFFSDMRKGL